MSNNSILFYHNGTREEMDAEQLEEMMERSLGGKIQIWGISVKKEDTALEASISGGDDFPGMDINAVTDDGRLYVLANAELKNSDNPFLTTRLYAGNTEFETDSPVVFMAHGERNKEDDSKRAVYVDKGLVSIYPDTQWGVGDCSDVMLTDESKVNVERKRYIITMDESYIRDSQFYSEKRNCDEDNNEDAWTDFSAPAYLGIIQATSEKAAIQKMAVKEGFLAEALRAEEI